MKYILSQSKLSWNLLYSLISWFGHNIYILEINCFETSIFSRISFSVSQFFSSVIHLFWFLLTICLNILTSFVNVHADDTAIYGCTSKIQDAWNFVVDLSYAQALTMQWKKLSCNFQYLKHQTSILSSSLI